MLNIHKLWSNSLIQFRLVKYGETIVAGVGKFNGSVVQRGRAGYIQRVKVKPVNTASTSSTNNKARFSVNSSAWRSLTEAQRQSWIDAAPDFPYSDWFGDRRTLTGNSLYIKLNQVLAGMGIAANASAPAAIAVGLATAVSLAGDASAHTLALVYTPTPIPAGFELMIEATPQVSAGIYFLKNKYTVLQYIDAAGASPAALGTAYELAHGVLVAGKKIGVRVRLVSKTTGQIGIATEVTTIVVP